MKLWRKAAVLSLCLLALTGCTKSSISNEAPVTEAAGNMAADKAGEDDETLPREENFLIEDETEEESMYDWEQVKDETDDLFVGNPAYPQSEKMEFTADEAGKSITLTWIVKDGTTAEQAMDYAVDMVKNFNDIVAVQTEDLSNSTDTSFGDLWKEFALTVQVGTKDGTWLVNKSYNAGDMIDLTMRGGSESGPKGEYSDGPNKDNGKN